MKQMNKPVHNSISKTSKASGNPAGISVLGAGRKKAAKKRLTNKERKFARAQAYFDDLRQQYADGKLSKRQIHCIDERIPGFFAIQPFERADSYFHGLLCQAGRIIFGKSDESEGIKRIFRDCLSQREIYKIALKSALGDKQIQTIPSDSCV
jgi:hypothetical protein